MMSLSRLSASEEKLQVCLPVIFGKILETKNLVIIDSALQRCRTPGEPFKLCGDYEMHGVHGCTDIACSTYLPFIYTDADVLQHQCIVCVNDVK